MTGGLVDIGIHLAPCRSDAVGAAMRGFARAADDLGYHRVWACEHDGAPFDALTTLAFLAALTERVALGAMVRADTWKTVHLARSLATLHALGAGRLTAAVDPGSTDVAVLTPTDGARGPGTPAPRLLLTATSPEDLTRIALHADGWLIDATTPPAAISVGSEHLRATASRSGRDPDALRLVARATVRLGPATAGRDRLRYVGSAEQIALDLAALRDVGVDEVVLMVPGQCGLDIALETYATVAEAMGLASRDALRGARLT